MCIVVFVCMLCFDKTNPVQRKATEDIFHGLFEEGKKLGFAKYRAHINHMGKLSIGVTLIVNSEEFADSGTDMVADLFDFNDHAYRRFVETLKVTTIHV